MKMDKNKQDYFDEIKNRAKPAAWLIVVPLGLIFWGLIAWWLFSG